MGPAKLRKWTEEETQLLIELAQRKERVPAMAREIGRHITSVRRRELGLPLPPGRGERQLQLFSRHRRAELAISCLQRPQPVPVPTASDQLREGYRRSPGVEVDSARGAFAASFGARVDLDSSRHRTRAAR